ncbi:unnamed protein product, partial [Symbiodinium sp. CCMP2592]
ELEATRKSLDVDPSVPGGKDEFKKTDLLGEMPTSLNPPPSILKCSTGPASTHSSVPAKGTEATNPGLQRPAQEAQMPSNLVPTLCTAPPKPSEQLPTAEPQKPSEPLATECPEDPKPSEQLPTAEPQKPSEPLATECPEDPKPKEQLPAAQPQKPSEPLATECPEDPKPKEQLPAAQPQKPNEPVEAKCPECPKPTEQVQKSKECTDAFQKHLDSLCTQDTHEATQVDDPRDAPQLIAPKRETSTPSPQKSPLDVPVLGDVSAPEMPRVGQHTLSKAAIDARARRIFTLRSNGQKKVSEQIWNEWHKGKGSKERATLEQIFARCGYSQDRG